MSWPEYIIQIEPHEDGELFHMRGDPEPIVRCRDCKHFETDECKCRYFVTPCTPDGAIVNRAMLSLNVDPDGFCAWGERKDE